MRRFVLWLFVLCVAISGCAAPPVASLAPEVAVTEQAVFQIKFLVYLGAAEPGGTWQERDNAAWAKAQAIIVRFPGKQALPDYPDDANVYRGLNPRSRGYSHGFTGEEQEDLTPEEFGALLNDEPVEPGTGREWGNVDGI